MHRGDAGCPGYCIEKACLADVFGADNRAAAVGKGGDMGRRELVNRLQSVRPRNWSTTPRLPVQSIFGPGPLLKVSAAAENYFFCNSVSSANSSSLWSLGFTSRYSLAM